MDQLPQWVLCRAVEPVGAAAAASNLVAVGRMEQSEKTIASASKVGAVGQNEQFKEL
jgi:hypothetical protein